jgi:hypothetical protein
VVAVAEIERRPHKRRPCMQKGCGWMQVTSWFVGGPHNIVKVSDKFLELETTAHMLVVHGRTMPPPKVFV